MILREDLQAPVTLLRFFREGQEWGDPYVAVLSLVWESPTVVEAVGLHGDITPQLYKELAMWFRDNGIKQVKASRSAGHTMPGARQSNGVFVFDVDAYWERHRP